MRTGNIFLKFSIFLIIVGLGIGSYFLYDFLYDHNNPLLEDQALPIPTLDINAYENIRSKYE